MRLWLTAVVILTGLTAPAAANLYPSAVIGLYGDAAGTVDAIHTDGLDQVSVYLLLRVNVSDYWSGIFWCTAVPPACFNVTYVEESGLSSFIGDSQSYLFFPGLMGFTYGTHIIRTITFSINGDTPECCRFDLQLELGTELSYSAEGLWINPDDPMTCVAPVEGTTWGAIKAMYR